MMMPLVMIARHALEMCAAGEPSFVLGAQRVTTMLTTTTNARSVSVLYAAELETRARRAQMVTTMMGLVMIARYARDLCAAVAMGTLVLCANQVITRMGLVMIARLAMELYAVEAWE
jgi:hypothetical protein